LLRFWCYYQKWNFKQNKKQTRMASNFKYKLGLFSVIFSLYLFVFFASAQDINTGNSVNISEKYKVFEPVVGRLLAKGVDSSFISELLSNPETKFDEKYVKINVTGFLKKTDYTIHHNELGVKRSKQFFDNNYPVLLSAERQFDVPAEVITAVLWVETRHGGYLGNNHVASVFLSAAMANEHNVLKMNLGFIEETYQDNAEELEKLRNKVYERSKKKANWALGELVALSKMQSKYNKSPLELRGSWAGAFGMSQFLPSSYMNWAIDGDGDGEIDLFKLDDAVFSVANYLKQNGWGKSAESHRKAVFHYNNSSDYVDAVLTLAGKIRPE